VGSSVRIGLALVALYALAQGCGDAERPARFQAQPPDRDAGGFGLDASVGPPPLDASGLCGNQVVVVPIERPNLYFVVDRSGSMREPVTGSLQSKYSATVRALGDTLAAVGHRVRYGGAVFPAIDNPDGCQPGEEIFETKPGDPATYAAQGQYGPVLRTFISALSRATPEGATPTATTLFGLLPSLRTLEGDTFVVLATDGAPNCNLQSICTRADCQLNIERQQVGNLACSPTSQNCCDPNIVPGGQGFCTDMSATEASVQELAANGIRTFVIGMPGSEVYGNLLDRLAVIGRTARPFEPHYYAVGDATSLSDTLRLIGTTVSVSCNIKLDQTPPDQRLVNVFFDATLVPYDAENGWAWTGADSFVLNGESCGLLQGGSVWQVQVVAGCPTEIK
jgi:hypothetical protein